MDLVTAISEISALTPSPRFPEAEKYILEFKENNPAALLQAFGEIAAHPQASEELKEKVIRIMTIVVEKNHHNFLNPYIVSPELTSIAFEALSPLTFTNSEICKEIFKTMAVFIMGCTEPSLVEEIISKFFEILGGEYPDFYLDGFLVMLSNTNCAYSNMEMCAQLIRVITSRENKEFTLKKSSYAVMSLLVHSSNVEEMQNENYQIVIEFFFFLAERSLKASFPLLPFIFDETVIEAFPEIPQRFAEFVVQDTEYVKLLYACRNIKCFNDEQTQALLDIAVRSISLEDQIKPSDHEDDEFFFEPRIAFVISSLFENSRSCIDLVIPFIMEHIQEDGTNEKYAAAILNFRVQRFFNPISNNDDFVIGENGLIEECPIDQTQIIDFLTEDSNPLIQKYGIFVKCDLIINGKLEVTEELIKDGLERFYSGDNCTFYGGDTLLYWIVKKSNEEACAYIVTNMVETLLQTDTEEGIIASKRIYLFLKRIARSMSEQVTNDLMDTLCKYVFQVFQENSDTPQISWCIDTIGELIKVGKVTNPESIQGIIQFIDALFQEGCDEDALYLMTMVCMKNGEENQEMLEFAIQYVFEHLNNPRNEKELKMLFALSESIVKYINEPEQLNNITILIIGYLQNKRLKNFACRNSNIILSIFIKNPEVIELHAQEIVDSNYNRIPFIRRDIIESEKQLLSLLINTSIEMGKPYKAIEYRKSYVYGILRLISRSSYSIKGSMQTFMEYMADTTKNGMPKAVVTRNQYNKMLRASSNKTRVLFDVCFDIRE